MSNKKQMTGDGLSLYLATKTSIKTGPEIYNTMDISNGTYYALFYKDSIDKATKEKAAKALGKKVTEIFSSYQVSQKKPDDYEAKYYDLLERYNAALEHNNAILHEKMQSLSDNAKRMDDEIGGVSEMLEDLTESIGRLLPLETLKAVEKRGRNGKSAPDVLGKI